MRGSRDIVLLALFLRLQPQDAGTIERLRVQARETPEQACADLLAANGLLSPAARPPYIELSKALLGACAGNLREALGLLGGGAALHGILPMPETSFQDKTTPMPEEHAVLFEAGPGSVVDETPGRYTHVSQHAQGGMGRILLVHDTTTGRDVALKELLPDSEGTTRGGESPVRYISRLAARFLQEGRITAQLEHPSIVPVYEVGRRWDGSLYYTMKLVRGRTLSAAIREAPGMKERLALLPHYLDLCQAVAYAHDRGVIHRDIKPLNVMVGAFGETVVLDWGIAKRLRGDDPLAEEIQTVPGRIAAGDTGWETTAYGAAIGTPQYMAPEQAAGRLEAIGKPSDVYSLGVVLYEMLTGTVPFRGKSIKELLHRAQYDTPPPIASLVSDAPPELAGICEKAMAHDPAQRYADAQALAEEITRFQAGLLVKAYSYSFRDLAVRYYRKHRPLVHTIALATATSLAIAAYAYASIYLAREREKAQRMAAEQAAYVAQIRLADSLVRSADRRAAEDTLATAQPALRQWEWGWLQAQCNETLLTLAGHEASVMEVLYTPAGAPLTWSGDGTVRLWDPDTGASLATAAFGASAVRDIALDGQGETVAVALQDGTVRLLSMPSLQERQRLVGHTGPVNQVNFVPGDRGLISAASDGTIRRWDLHNGQQINSWSCPDLEIKSATLSAEGDLIAWSEPGRLYRWRQGQTESEPPVHGIRARLDPAGRRVAYLDGATCFVWDVSTQEAPHPVGLGDTPLFLVRWSPDGQHLLTGDNAGTLRLYDLAQDRLLYSVAMPGAIRTAAFAPSGLAFAAGNSAGQFDVRATESGALLRSGLAFDGALLSLCWAADGETLLGGGADGTARVWRADTSPHQTVVARHDAAVTALATDATGTRLASLDMQGVLRITDLIATAPLQTWATRADRGADAVAFRPGSSQVAVALDGYTVLLLNGDAVDGLLEDCAHFHHGLAYAPDGTLLATGDEIGMVRLWQPDTRALLRGWDAHIGAVHSVTFDAPGRRLLTAGADGEARIWDVASGTLLRQFKADKPLSTAVFNETGDRILTAGADRHAQLWDANTGAPLWVYAGHNAELTGATFQPGGDRILTSSWDGNDWLWDSTTGARLLALAPPRGNRAIACWTPGGDGVISARAGGEIDRMRALPWHLDDAGLAASLAERCAAVRQTAGTRKHATESVNVLLGAPERQILFEQLAAALSAPERADGEGLPADIPLLGVLQLRTGDRLVHVGDVAVTGASATAAALRAISASEAPFELGVVRNGETIAIRYLAVPPLSSERSMQLAQADARSALQHMLHWLNDAPETILEVSNRFSGHVRAAEAPHGPLIDGVWLAAADTAENRTWLDALALTSGDRITQVNGVAISELNALTTALEAALTQIEQHVSTTLDLRGYRGAFVTLQRTVEIR